ncbi:MAG: DUF4380 domain-containing protein [Planctomycetota bacterium]|jgi:hypothetical protein
MKLFFKTSIVLVALIPLMQSCSRLSTVVDGTFSDKTKLVKEWRTYKGWNSICLSNGFIELYIVPQIGGRIIQYKLDDKEFFWVNPQLAGTLPPATGLDPNGNWLNYGGDKLWPAPQGWDNDQQWPGPPDAVLDGQPYNMEHLPIEKNGAAGVRMTSRNDPRSGIRFSRVIRLHPNGTRVSIEATMMNVDNKPRRWGIWAHTQLDGGRSNGSGHNELMNAFCPINPKSHFAKGYNVIFGEKGNPSFRADVATGMMKVNYQYRVGKIGVDSHAGWVATVDGENGSAFIHRFTFESDKPYPDGSSVQFWLNGLGSIHAYNKNIEMPTTVSDNPYVFESEVLSPFAQLDPGESYTYKYEWLSTKIGGDYAIVDCTGAGVVCEPMGAIWKEEKLHLTGRFGVFAPGRLRLSLFGKKGEKLLSHVIGEKVSPIHRFAGKTG